MTGNIAFKLPDTANRANPTPVKLRCPLCHERGVFHGIGIEDAQWSQETVHEGRQVAMNFYAGVRRCPSPSCHTVIFVLLKGTELLRSYPPEVIDFDSTNIPARIETTLSEALKCHAHECYKAAAIMVRRLLEEICADREVKGSTLKARIGALGTKVVIPKELLDAADELRLLGNDAAHIEAKAYDDVGKDEVEATIELAKEILKAVYQYEALLTKLRGLRTKTE